MYGKIRVIYRGKNINLTAGPVVYSIEYSKDSKKVELIYRHVGNGLKSDGDLKYF